MAQQFDLQQLMQMKQGYVAYCTTKYGIGRRATA
jgi:hypothetical protein